MMDRALVLESDPLVRERAAAMLAEAGVQTCCVADTDLFGEIRSRLRFDLFVVGVPDLESVPPSLPEGPEPVLLLAPADPQTRLHLRARLPGARLVDRRLRDAGGLRDALEPRSDAPGGLGPDVVRGVFEPFKLSERQLQVVGRALLGESSAEIARRLYVSELTIRNHLHAIYERVGVSGRRELSGRFVRGLLEGPALSGGPDS